MDHTHQSTRTYEALHLLYRVGFVCLGLAAFALATSTRGAAIAISTFLGILLIACAFTRLPAAVVSYTRARQGVRPRYEAFFSVVVPLVLSMVAAWVAYSDASDAYYLSGFITLRWTNIARPIIGGIEALLFLGVFVANAVLLLRRRP